MSDTPQGIDRRVTLQWLLAAMASPAVPLQGAYAAPAPARAPSPWPAVAVSPVAAPGYGTDPNLLEPIVPWPKTLTAAQLATAAALADTILPAEGEYPAPSSVGVQHFIDEWVSAPYAEQAADRPLLLGGFAWVEAESRARHNKLYADVDESARTAILADAAAVHPTGKSFLDRMKFLTAGAYYTSEAGIEELGYVGNVAIEGDHPGPTPEALAHLDQVLSSLNLRRA